jgi:AraC family transcriptional regulator
MDRALAKTHCLEEGELVQTRRRRPVDVPASSGDDQCTVRDAAAYDGALKRFGGRRLEARSSVRSGELLVALYESPPYDLNVAPLDIARLSVNLANVPVYGGIGSNRSRNYKGRRHSLFYTPAGSDAHWVKPHHSRHLNIYFRDGVVDELADGQAALLSPDRPLMDVHVRRINRWIDALELSIGHGCPFADDASLGLAHLIIADLASAPGRRRPTLAPAALARVRDYIAAHLAETIRVAELAALTGLSVGRFALCFRASTGCSPHRYVLGQRVETAIRLLRYRPMPMAEVAVECGFSSQQHMATMMRRLAGVAPSSVRRGCSGPPE